MITYLGDKLIPLTPEAAMEHATMQAAPGERPLRDERVEWLRSLLNARLFFSPDWAVATMDGVVYRMNGQHSSNMLSDAFQEGAFPRGLNVMYRRFRVESEVELAALFDLFDNRNSTRKPIEILTAHKASEPSLRECNNRDLGIIAGGIAYAKCNTSGQLDPADRARLIHSHQAFILWACQFEGVRHLMKVGPMAAMHTTWNIDVSRANQFWQHVAHETHHDPDNASRVLARFLRDTIIPRGARTAMRWDTRSLMVKCIHGWNAYWQNASTALKYVPSAPIPRAMASFK
jgi:hypothetical protein